MERVTGTEFSLVDAEIGVLELSVAQAVAEVPLHAHIGVIVIYSSLPLKLLGPAEVIVRESVRAARVGVWQTGAEVLVAAEKEREGIAAVVARKKHVHHGGSERLDVGYDARTSLVEHEYQWLAGGCKFTHQALLVRGKIEVGYIARSFAIAVLAYAADNHVAATGGCDGLVHILDDILLPVPARNVAHGFHELHVLFAETLRERLVYGVVLLVETGLVTALPGVAPAAVETAHRVGVRAGHEYAAALGYREHPVVLEQYFGFHRSIESHSAEFFAGEALIIFAIPYRLFEKAEAGLETEHPAACVVYALAGHGSFFDQFLEQSAEADVVWLHSHIDARIDGYANGVLLVSGDELAGVEIVYVVEVGDNHSVPSELFLHPLEHIFAVGVERYAAVAGRVDHYGQGSRLQALAERFEVTTPHIDVGD